MPLFFTDLPTAPRLSEVAQTIARVLRERVLEQSVTELEFKKGEKAQHFFCVKRIFGSWQVINCQYPYAIFEGVLEPYVYVFFGWQMGILQQSRHFPMG